MVDLGDMDRKMREDARLIILKALAKMQPDETLHSGYLQETEASLSQGTHYVWIEPVNADDMPGPASGPFTITIV